MDRSVEPNQVARQRARFEKRKKGFGVEIFGGLILGSPVGIGQGDDIFVYW